MGDGLEDLDLLGQKIAPLLGDQRHHAPRLALHGNGQGELCEVGAYRLELREPRIGERRGIEVGDDQPSRAGRLADVRAVHRPHADAGREIGRETALGDQRQGAVRRIELLDAAHVHLRQRADHVEHLTGGGDDIGRAAHAERHGVEGLELAIAAGQLGIGIGRLGLGKQLDRSSARRAGLAVKQEHPGGARERTERQPHEPARERASAAFAVVRDEHPKPARARNGHVIRGADEEVAPALEAEPAGC